MSTYSDYEKPDKMPAICFDLKYLCKLTLLKQLIKDLNWSYMMLKVFLHCFYASNAHVASTCHFFPHCLEFQTRLSDRNRCSCPKKVQNTLVSRHARPSEYRVNSSPLGMFSPATTRCLQPSGSHTK